MASRLTAAYERFVVKHAEAVGVVETYARMLTLAVPGRFGDAEVAAEGLRTAVNVLSQVHDMILSKYARRWQAVRATAVQAAADELGEGTSAGKGSELRASDLDATPPQDPADESHQRRW